jgi:hypothetical protein
VSSTLPSATVSPPGPAGTDAPATPRAYTPPRLGGKQPLEQVTLFSFACTPGDPNCPIGRP